MISFHVIGISLVIWKACPIEGNIPGKAADPHSNIVTVGHCLKGAPGVMDNNRFVVKYTLRKRPVRHLPAHKRPDEASFRRKYGKAAQSLQEIILAVTFKKIKFAGHFISRIFTVRVFKGILCHRRNQARLLINRTGANKINWRTRPLKPHNPGGLPPV